MAAAEGAAEQGQDDAAADNAATAVTLAAVAAAAAAQAGNGAAAPAEDDYGDLEMTGELDLDTALLQRRYAAERAGMFIDLTRDAPDVELEQALEELNKVCCFYSLSSDSVQCCCQHSTQLLLPPPCKPLRTDCAVFFITALCITYIVALAFFAARGG